MIQFGNLLIEGFCSVGRLELNLGINSITVIRGATGEGKTTILSALVWCLYGKNLKGKSDVNTWKKYQPKDYQGTKVEIYFNTPKGTHKIIRCQKYKGEVNGAKGKDRLVYEIDATEVSAKGKGEIQALINADLGMSYNLFMNSILFGQGMKRLIQESGTDKKNLFEEIFELDYLSKARDIAKGEYQEAQSRLSTLLKKHQLLQEKYDSAKETVSDLKEQAEDHTADLEKEIQKLEKLKKARAKAKNELEHKELVTRKDDLQKELEKYQEKISELREKIDAARDKSKISLEDFIDELVKLLKRGNIKSSLKRVLEIKDAFITVEKSRDKVDTLNQKISKIRSSLNELRSKESEYQDILDDIEDYNKQISRLQKEKDKKVNTSLIGKYRKLAKQYKAKYLRLDKRIEVRKKDVEDHKWVYEDPLGNKGIKAFLFESSLDYLNEVLESYSDVLGFSILFYVDLQGTKKDFATQIVMDGIEVSYDELSGGQKQLCNLAMAFAMNEVMTKAKGINIAFLDEVFENLSSEYVELVIGLIRRVYRDKTLFLISHQDSLPIPNSRVLTVTRARGISQYQ